MVLDLSQLQSLKLNILEEQKKSGGSRRREKPRYDRKRKISRMKKIREKDAEELKGSRRDSKGSKKTEKVEG